MKIVFTTQRERNFWHDYFRESPNDTKLDSLEAEIITVLDATNTLKESPGWELHQLVEREPEVFERVVEKQIEGINAEVTELKTQAEKLEREIEELEGAR